MDIRDYIKNNILILDGGMGTLLQQKGLMPGEEPALWNLTHPDIISEIHKKYFDAGSNVISTNTFGISRLKFSSEKLEEIIASAVENCICAKSDTCSKKDKFIAFDIGPLGKMLKPYGELDFEEAVSLFAENVRIADKLPVDLFFIETMTDSYETKAALLAVKENSDKPVFVSNAYSENGKLLTGATPAAMACLAESMGADAVGANCSFGPEATLPVVKELLAVTDLPVIIKPNAGMPVFTDGKTEYNISADVFADLIYEAIASGVNIVGGCCGTTPEYIKAISDRLCGCVPTVRTSSVLPSVSSYTHSVAFGERPVLIGERINPTGKKRFKQALLEHDIDYILCEGQNQQDKGVHILDVNVGLAGINEAEMLPTVVKELQAVCDLPLQLDSADPVALERAMRIYNGVPLVNSVNGKQESMDKIFPLIKKYGGILIALTLDENGIPDSVDGRLRIAEKILNEAAKYGIKSSVIIFDPLAMTISADADSANVTLQCISRITSELNCKTSLGISNVSFGLPSRDILNASFFIQAMNNGLSAAIINPYSDRIMAAYYSYCALNGLDPNFENYINFADVTEQNNTAMPESADDRLFNAVFRGRADAAERITAVMLSCSSHIDIINSEIIPALNKAGTEFQNGRMYLPQLLMCAEAASSAFDIIKSSVAITEQEKKCKVVLATVRGDIHDIGKNIVRLLLENYGYEVIDLGKDVSPETICDAVKKHRAPLLGLSALMTTTLDAMKETVELVKNECGFCRIFVGGAVVTSEFAASVFADAYAADATASVKFAENVYAEII